MSLAPKKSQKLFEFTNKNQLICLPWILKVFCVIVPILLIIKNCLLLKHSSEHFIVLHAGSCACKLSSVIKEPKGLI